MALQDFWGFENGVVPDGFEAQSISGVPTLFVTTDDVASGKYCLTVDNLASSPTRISVPVKQNSADLFVGFNFKVTTLETRAEIICLRVGDAFVSVFTQSDGSLEAQVRDQAWPSNRGTSLGRSRSSAVIKDRWTYLSFHIKPRETTGLVDIYRSGHQLASFHKAHIGKNSSERELFLGGKPTSGHSFVDDLVIADSGGSGFNGIITPVAIEAFKEDEPLPVKSGHRLIAASAIYDDGEKKITNPAKALTETMIRKLARS